MSNNKQQEVSKKMAVMFLNWFCDPDEKEKVDAELVKLNPDDLTDKLYDVWLSKYFVPDTIPQPLPDKEIEEVKEEEQRQKFKEWYEGFGKTLVHCDVIFDYFDCYIITPLQSENTSLKDELKVQEFRINKKISLIADFEKIHGQYQTEISNLREQLKEKEERLSKMKNKVVIGYKELKEDNNKLIEALKKIEQMSDPGSYEAAIIQMKSIASAVLKGTEI